MAAGNPDGDSFTTLHEWLADTDPLDPRSFLGLTSIESVPALSLRLNTSANWRYTLFSATTLTDGMTWTPVPGQSNVQGTGGILTLTDNPVDPRRYYRVGVAVPDVAPGLFRTVERKLFYFRRLRRATHSNIAHTNRSAARATPRQVISIRRFMRTFTLLGTPQQAANRMTTFGLATR